MAGVGVIIGFVDVANKGFAPKAVALYSADLIMTGVAFLGPVGAGAAAIYFHRKISLRPL